MQEANKNPQTITERLNQTEDIHEIMKIAQENIKAGNYDNDIWQKAKDKVTRIVAEYVLKIEETPQAEKLNVRNKLAVEVGKLSLGTLFTASDIDGFLKRLTIAATGNTKPEPPIR